MKILNIVFLFISLFAPKAFADGRLDMMGGFYSIDAKSNLGVGKLSSLGSYAVTYNYNFLDKVDFAVGYSLFFSKVFSGDMGYGPDLGFSYYYLTSSGPTVIKTDSVQLRVEEIVRPFFNLSFNQRQIQSTESSYAGLSLGLGAQFVTGQPYDLKGLVRYQSLNGPSGSTASFFDILIGISFGI